MDAETRHQLKQNELAEALKKVKSLDERTRLILLLVVLVLVAILAYRLWQGRKSDTRAAGWQELSSISIADATTNSGSLDQLRTLIEEHSEPRLLAMARLRLAQGLMAKAAAGEQREASLNEALGLLNQVVDEPQTPDAVAAAAVFDLGTAHESLGALEKAKAAYERLTTDKRFADLPFVTLAEDRLASIDELARQVSFKPGLPPPPPPPTTQPQAQTTPASQPAEAPEQSGDAVAPAEAGQEAAPPADDEPASRPAEEAGPNDSP